MILRYIKSFTLGLLICMAACVAAGAQTSSFTYQGKLTDNSVAANASYQMQFALFDASAGGSQIGAVITLPAVQVTNGIFTVNLDFGAGTFSGANRYLQIAVFSTTESAFVPLNPRQAVTSAPYAVKALNADTAEMADNAANLGGLPASSYVQTVDPRLSDSRDPNPGSGNYVQNRTTPQAGTNFSIDGNGTAGGTLTGNAVNSVTQFNIGNSRVLGVAGTNNTFTGFGAGTANSGTNNSFFGRSAGFDNAAGSQNSFFGSAAGANNTAGSENSFFGSGSGDTNTTGNLNSFFGRAAGGANTTGSSNTFIGRESGLANNTGFFNTFLGRNAGDATTTGFQNTFIGANAGSANIDSNNNTFVGFNAGSANVFGNNNTLIGYNTRVSSFFHIVSNSTAIGAGAVVDQSDTIVLGTNSMRVEIPGLVDSLRVEDDVETNYLRVNSLYGGGDTEICMASPTRTLASCSSSRRYKHNIANFTPGLSLIKLLRPVTFDWNADNSHDLGLVAEEVAEIEPLLASYKDGQIEGVKYNRVGVVLVNAVKEQQTQIDALKQQVELLKAILCAKDPAAGVCGEVK